MRSKRNILAVLAMSGTLALASAAPALAQTPTVVYATGALVDYSATTAEPTDGASARLVAVSDRDGHTRAILVLSGLHAPAGQVFGAHAHTGPCVDAKSGGGGGAGPHYRVPGGIADPQHELWLDFTVLPQGHAFADTTAPFVIPNGAARSIVIHARPTAPGGNAGPRLACLPINF